MITHFFQCLNYKKVDLYSKKVYIPAEVSLISLHLKTASRHLLAENFLYFGSTFSEH